MGSRGQQPGLMPGARQAKESVNYRPHEKCGTCGHFYGGHCDQVEGNISPDAVCDRWELTVSKYRDKDFFKREFDKGMNQKYTTDKQGKGKEFYITAREAKEE